MGRHTCPSCGEPSRLRRRIWYLVRIFLAECLGAIPFGFIFHWWLGGPWFILGLVFGGLLVGIPIDRFLDDKHRPLEKIESHNAA